MTQSEIDFFDKLAPEWDANEVRSTPERINAILDLLPFKNGCKVLDLGTGTGVLIPYIRERIGKSGKIAGIDFSAGMLAIAQKKYGDLPGVELLRIDFEEEQIPGEYDIVMLYSVFPHLHYPKETLEWLFRMNISREGCVVIAFPSDEKFINAIHHERKSDSDHLLPASQLSAVIQDWGFHSEVVANNKDAYVIIVKRGKETVAE